MMELGLPVSAHTDLGRRAAPIACGGALAASAAFLATHDPGAAGSRYPTCVFHQMTGLWCPGCGLTRGAYQLLHGHVGAAMSYNIFTPLALVTIVAAWFLWVRAAWGAIPIRVSQRAARSLAVILSILVLGYGVLRNLPVDPLRALAP
jgi:hypothetical protein